MAEVEEEGVKHLSLPLRPFAVRLPGSAMSGASVAPMQVYGPPKIVIRTIPHRFVWHPGPSVQSTLIHQKDMQHLWRPSRYNKVQTITITSDIVRIHNRVNFIDRPPGGSPI